MFSSCCSDEETYGNLKRPITVIGKVPEKDNSWGTIILQDAKGRVVNLIIVVVMAVTRIAAVKQLPNLRNETKLRAADISKPEKYYLTISKHNDGSGGRLELSSGIDVQKMLIVIEKELLRQLREFNEQFKKL